MPRALVGVSGWRYPAWRGDFYPKGLPQAAPPLHRRGRSPRRSARRQVKMGRSLTEAAVYVPLGHAREARRKSFGWDEAHALCTEHGVAVVVADSAGTWPVLHDATSDFRYVRLHGETELYASGYTDASLDRRAGSAWAGATPTPRACRQPH